MRCLRLFSPHEQWIEEESKRRREEVGDRRVGVGGGSGDVGVVAHNMFRYNTYATPYGLC